MQSSTCERAWRVQWAKVARTCWAFALPSSVTRRVRAASRSIIRALPLPFHRLAVLMFKTALDQVDDDAINLNSFLYPEIVARITHKDIKKIVEAESQELVTNLLLILRRELGNTKGTQAVMLHREHAVLRYVDLRSFVVQMRRFRAYRQKIDPDLALRPAGYLGAGSISRRE